MNNLMQWNTLNLIWEKHQIQQCNAVTCQYGLTLSEAETEELIQVKQKTLQEVGRVEFQSTIIEQMITEFCDSHFLNKYNYVEVLHQLVEIFYYYKDATEDYLSDEEIIHYMKLAYDGCCQGSLDYLSEEQINVLVDDLNNGLNIYVGLEYGDI